VRDLLLTVLDILYRIVVLYSHREDRGSFEFLVFSFELAVWRELRFFDS